MLKTFRFTDQDLSLLAKVKMEMKASSDTDVIRRLLREFSDSELPTKPSLVEKAFPQIFQDDPYKGWAKIQDSQDYETGDSFIALKNPNKPWNTVILKADDPLYEKYK